MIEDLAKFMFIRNAKDYCVRDEEAEGLWGRSERVRAYWAVEAKAVLAFIDRHSGGKASNQWLEAVWKGAQE